MSLDEQPSVLLAEADPVLGLDLSDALERAGYRVLGPVDTLATALRCLKADTPTLAVIDVVLKDGLCAQLSRELRQRGIPFLVHSDCQRDQRLTGDVEDAPWLVKPAPPEDVMVLLDGLFFSTPVPTNIG